MYGVRMYGGDEAGGWSTDMLDVDDVMMRYGRAFMRLCSERLRVVLVDLLCYNFMISTPAVFTYWNISVHRRQALYVRHDINVYILIAIIIPVSLNRPCSNPFPLVVNPRRFIYRSVLCYSFPAVPRLRFSPNPCHSIRFASHCSDTAPVQASGNNLSVHSSPVIPILIFHHLVNLQSSNRETISEQQLLFSANISVFWNTDLFTDSSSS